MPMMMTADTNATFIARERKGQLALGARGPFAGLHRRCCAAAFSAGDVAIHGASDARLRLRRRSLAIRFAARWRTGRGSGRRCTGCIVAALAGFAPALQGPGAQATLCLAQIVSHIVDEDDAPLPVFRKRSSSLLSSQAFL
eukprot:6212255-Pleurochrysis_carterae.AAC.2